MNFGKVFLVLKREYITRARSKSFILSTILTPLVLMAFGALMVWIMTSDTVRSDLREVIQEERLSRANVTDEIKALFELRPQLDTRKLTAEGESEDDKAGFMSAVGFILGLLIFIGLFGYGAILMRSVIEEKTSRIVEIITSSIKPMELLVGKVVGVCLLGFTQFAVWIVMYVGISIAAVPVAGLLMQDQLADVTSNPEVTAWLIQASTPLRSKYSKLTQ